MKKATKDFAAWIKGIEGLDDLTAAYEKGMITLMDYIKGAREKELKDSSRLSHNSKEDNTHYPLILFPWLP